MKNIEGFDGLNGLDVGCPLTKEYMKLIQRIAGSPDNKVGKDTESLELKLDVVTTLNLSQINPLDHELKYAVEYHLKI
jgi:hypothetical protein